jgi:exosortase A-associated hydrolase 2
VSGIDPITEAFFLPASSGYRFALLRVPKSGDARKSVIYLHPFAEEMNKSRRMATLQATALVAAGYRVLQLDLKGCGDSSEDFGDATWDDWIDDVSLAYSWMQNRFEGAIYLWGLRLGATLAMEFHQRTRIQPKGFILWAPVLNGETFLTQFLRLRVANERLATSSFTSNPGNTNDLKRELRQGRPVEVAGYALNPRLALPIDSLRLLDLAPDAVPVSWLEVVSDPQRPLAPAIGRVVDSWRDKGVGVHMQFAAGEPFWATQEIGECPGLIQMTSDVLARMA